MPERNIRVSSLERPPVNDQTVELVERKGLGHPDSICDGVAEAVAQRLANEYIDRFGRVLHFNTDETQLVAGSSNPAFGGGEVNEPIYLLIVGRATKQFDGQPFPAERIALEAAREYVESNFPRLSVGTDMVIDTRLGQGSGDLQTVFGEMGTEIPAANDTSFGVGHAPLSDTERLVLEAERSLNGAFSRSTPALGPDIKIMGKREDNAVDLTIAAAAIDEHIDDTDGYRSLLADIADHVYDLAADITTLDVDIAVNTADDIDNGSIYLTTTGTSAEHGDDGSVGRGNRCNGLITPNRSMSLEATSGKNPVNHIGKIYNVLAYETAKSVVNEVDDIRDLRVRLLSQIGQPIDQPQIADIHVLTADGVDVDDLTPEIVPVVDDRLANVTDITRQLIDGEITTF